jgi:mannosylglycoprotein endo-beta-mannosidase
MPLERWQNKIRRLRQYLRGWATHTAGTYKKEKKRLLSLLENLDKKAETTTLSDQEIHLKHFLKERLVLLLREEELKWYERAKVKTLLEGDDNTRFFHLVANGKHRKQHIYKLENDQGVMIGDELIKSHIIRYYKGLFGSPKVAGISLEESQISDIPQVSQEENEILTREFTESEVREAVFQMEHNKAPGPDSFQWNSIKFSGKL